MRKQACICKAYLTQISGFAPAVIKSKLRWGESETVKPRAPPAPVVSTVSQDLVTRPSFYTGRSMEPHLPCIQAVYPNAARRPASSTAPVEPGGLLRRRRSCIPACADCIAQSTTQSAPCIRMGNLQHARQRMPALAAVVVRQIEVHVEFGAGSNGGIESRIAEVGIWRKACVGVDAREGMQLLGKRVVLQAHGRSMYGTRSRNGGGDEQKDESHG